jgi:beta-galactosidase
MKSWKFVWLMALTCLFALMVFASCGDDDDDDGLVDDGDDGGDYDDDDDDDDAGPESPARQTLSLNGTWDVEQGDLGETPPAQFTHTVSVPALMNSAEPAFAEVGEESDLREAFWYQTTFDAPEATDTAILHIHKAKYGMAVWLNGEYLGEYLGCFTLASFDARSAIEWGSENTLLVRVGHHRTILPETIPSGQDAEKEKWIPGIYDDVEIVFSGSPHIVRTKVETDIDTGKIKAITTLRNDRISSATVSLESRIAEWENGAKASEAETSTVIVKPGEETDVVQTIAIDSPHLWSTDDPFLYELHSKVLLEDAPLDELDTRFGMRKVQWKSGADKGFYLNDELLYLRGSNLTLHRFFEDELVGTLPWDRDWVRKLLTEYPRLLNWNSFRISVGRAPNFWYDIADEEGLILADEFQMWDFIDNANKTWSAEEMGNEFAAWIKEAWNHPSIAWWDSSNESFDDMATQAVEMVRHLDPTRQWENGGFKAPHGPDDPIEDHPYIFFTLFVHNDADDVDDNDGLPPQGGIPALLRFTYDDTNHAYINNEYAWLWITRAGSPTWVAWKVYYDILGPGSHSPDQYREAYAYLVGGQTAFWRAKRGYAAVQHFSHLGYDRPGGNTCDNFIDIENLVLEPRWFKYAKSAFSPHLVYIDSWSDSYPASTTVQIPVQVISDYPEPFDGTVTVLAVSELGTVLSESTPQPVSLESYGAEDFQIELVTPSESKYVIFAELAPDDQTLDTVYSRRKVGYANIGDPGPEPPF